MIQRALRTLRREGGHRAEWLRERLRRTTFPLRVRHLSGPTSVSVGFQDAVVVCVVRNGAVYLSEFLDHYRDLGVRHVVLLDNGSTDGTVEAARDEPGVTLLQTEAPFQHIKVLAKQYLAERFGGEGWVLGVDIDELYDYPFRDRVPLGSFLGYLNGREFSAVLAHLLDLFPRGPLRLAGEEWRRDHRYYSLQGVSRRPYHKYGEGYNELWEDHKYVYFGGIRKSKFEVSPLLTKHPLFRPSAGVAWVHPHYVVGARVADVSSVLLHYKYAPGFQRYAETISEEGSFSFGSREYRAYRDVLKDNPDLELYDEDARELRRVDQLIEEGFVQVSDRYVAWSKRGAAS